MPIQLDRQHRMRVLRLKHRLAALSSGLVLGLRAFSSFAQNTTGSQSSPADPVCGYIAGPHFYYEATQVKQGLSVDLIVGEAQINQPVTLRFFVNQKPRNVPVDKLQIEHEKFMHVIGARDDLQEFFHLHPSRVSPGIWEVTHTFAQGGNYKLWSDVKHYGTLYSFGHPVLTVVGNYGNENTRSFSNEVAVCSGYEITFKHSQPLLVGSTNELLFSIRDASGNHPEIENFLGAPMHLVILKNDLSVYIHGHPEALRPRAATLRFKQTFAKPGAYKVFAQFRPKEAKLPADEAILAEFWLKVVDGG